MSMEKECPTCGQIAVLEDGKYSPLEEHRPEARTTPEMHCAERLEEAKKLIEECLPYKGPFQLPHSLLLRMAIFLNGSQPQSSEPR